MTEQEWRANYDLERILNYLWGRVSDRKFRLYFCGGCRQITHLFYRPDMSIPAIEVAERYADGQASRDALDAANWTAESPTFGYELTGRYEVTGERIPGSAAFRGEVAPRLVEMGVLPAAALSGDEWVLQDDVRQRLCIAAALAYLCSGSMPSDYAAAVRDPANEAWRESYEPENVIRRWRDYFHAVGWPGRELVDCVFGNPFRPRPAEPAWSAWHGDTIPQLGRAIYDGRALDRLPVLADTLEDAGCTDAELLAHLRAPVSHVRGCWALDELLGKA